MPTRRRKKIKQAKDQFEKEQAQKEKQAQQSESSITLGNDNYSVDILTKAIDNALALNPRDLVRIIAAYAVKLLDEDKHVYFTNQALKFRISPELNGRISTGPILRQMLYSGHVKCLEMHLNIADEHADSLQNRGILVFIEVGEPYVLEACKINIKEPTFKGMPSYVSYPEYTIMPNKIYNMNMTYGTKIIDIIGHTFKSLQQNSVLTITCKNVQMQYDIVKIKPKFYTILRFKSR